MLFIIFPPLFFLIITFVKICVNTNCVFLSLLIPHYVLF
nr:MAG TPA: hypothetical protein [Caudoviricetes sp.]